MEILLILPLAMFDLFALIAILKHPLTRAEIRGAVGCFYQREERMKFCLNCNKEVKAENNFCNSSCSASYNNRNRKKIKKENFCLYCSLSCKNKFCNNVCQKKHDHKEKIKEWLSGSISGVVGEFGTANFVKKYIIELQEGKCYYCSLNQDNWQGQPIVLQIDHQDGNHLNNRPENLKAICPNCHALTPTSGAKNMGKGRKKRKIYDERKNSAIRAMKKLSPC